MLFGVAKPGMVAALALSGGGTSIAASEASSSPHDEGHRPDLLGHPVSTRFDGDAVHLVASTTHADGARHEVVRSWPTTG